jgi:hypothetical protein
MVLFGSLFDQFVTSFDRDDMLATSEFDVEQSDNCLAGISSFDQLMMD